MIVLLALNSASDESVGLTYQVSASEINHALHSIYLYLMSLQEILERVALPEEDLQRSLLSLSLGKVRVLCKEPAVREINKSDRFRVNLGFESKATRIKVPQISGPTAAEASKQGQVGEPRDCEADASHALTGGDGEGDAGPKLLDRCSHCAHHEGQEDPHTQCPGRGGLASIFV